MSVRNLGRLLGEILRGYLRILRRISLFFLLILGAGAAGLLVTWPLWLFSTRHRQGYTLFMAGLLGGLIVLLIALRMRRTIRESGGFLPMVRLRWLPLLRRLLAALLLLALLYLVLLLIAGGLPLPGALAGMIFLLALGYAFRAAGHRR